MKINNNEQKKVSSIKNLTFTQLEKFITTLGFPKYRAEQIFKGLYTDRVEYFSEIKSIPQELREKLNENFCIDSLTIDKVRTSSDGSIKFLFQLNDKAGFIEAVYMPWLDEETNEIERISLCISSMAGCPVECSFCATGTMGLIKNLETAEIIDQLILVERYLDKKVSNIVFMGMGEPLLNYANVENALDIFTHNKSGIISRKRITLSTVGIANKINKLSAFHSPVKLAISLHATTNGFRNQIIPLSKNIDLTTLLDAVEYYYRKTKMPITYEYIPFLGLNDTDLDAKRLAKICKRVPSRINLIPFNDISFTGATGFVASLIPTPKEQVIEFGRKIVEAGGRVTIRDTFGTDIEAACGQLALSKD